MAGGVRRRLRPAALATALVFVVLGLMLAASAMTSRGTDLRAQRALDLRDLVQQRSDRVAGLEQGVSGLQQDVDSLLAADPAAAQTRAEIAALESTAGVAPMTGRALTVTLDDAPARPADDPLWQALSPDDVVVHQADVQAVINALWRGGARGIQVMDQRLVATSSIQCVGNTLLLQGRVYSPPFTITAVGPVPAMRESLRTDRAVADYRVWARAVGLGYDVTRRGTVTLPGYTGPVESVDDTPAASVPSSTPSQLQP